MATAAMSSNKAKIARRVVEVLDFFDENHREATVMDIVRRYGRPQSSTSELLSSLVELGLLYKDPYSRSYTLSPRAAMMGTSGQPEAVRDGRLVRLIERLVSQTGVSVAMVGMVGLNAQVFNWRPGPRASQALSEEIYGGLQTPLHETAPGLLLLSTIAQPRGDAVLRRLNAEAPDDRKFAFAEMAGNVRLCGEQGHVRGAIGFGTRAEMLAALVPGQPADRPMAIGFVYTAADKVSPENLLVCLEQAIAQTFGQDDFADETVVSRFPTAA